MWPENDKLALRAIWLIAAITLWQSKRGGASEALRNVLRRNPPLEWKSGARVVRVNE